MPAITPTGSTACVHGSGGVVAEPTPRPGYWRPRRWREDRVRRAEPAGMEPARQEGLVSCASCHATPRIAHVTPARNRSLTVAARARTIHAHATPSPRSRSGYLFTRSRPLQHLRALSHTRGDFDGSGISAVGRAITVHVRREAGLFIQVFGVDAAVGGGVPAGGQWGSRRLDQVEFGAGDEARCAAGGAGEAEAGAGDGLRQGPDDDLEWTRGTLNGPLLESLREGATFINTGRGAQVVEADLVRVLQARPDLTALLDVTAPEPPPRESALWQLPNVVISPHIGGTIGNEVGRLAECVIEEFEAWQAGRALRYQVTPEVLRTMG